MSPPVQELPTLYKPVPLYRLPLRGRHAQWSCPTTLERTLTVGRGGVGTTFVYQERYENELSETEAASVA